MIIKYLLSAFYITFSLTLSAQLDEIREILKSKPEAEETAIWLCDTAFTFHRNEPVLAQEIAELGLEKATKLGSDLASARANHVIGMSYWMRDEYEKSIQSYLAALNYYQRLDLLRGIALINMNIGIVYSELDQNEKAITYYLKSEDPLVEMGDSVNLGNLYLNLATAFAEISEDKLADEYFKSCLDVRIGIRDSVGVAGAYNNMAVVRLEKDSILTLENSAQASNYLNNALDYLEKEKDLKLFSLISLNIGRCFIGLNRFTEAEKYINQSQKIAVSKNYRLIEMWTYKYKSILFSKTGRHKEAFKSYVAQTELDEEISSTEVNEEIEELNIKFQTAKKEKLVAELEGKNAEEKGIRNILIVATTASLIIAVLLIFYVVQRRKKDQLIAELRLQKMSDAVTSKNKEIASYTMSFLQKNQLMEELKEQINELKKSSDISTNKELTRINKIVDNTFKSDEEWKTFQLTFDQMHHGFFKDLKQSFPDISNAELKLCALLRLNMNLKESAKILGIEPDSVKTARYRLRKKLGLKTEDNLVNFLIQFENRMAS